MKATLLMGAALSLLAIPAFGADLEPEMQVKAPPVPPPFTWTGCYGGAHVGGGWASKSLTDPVQLVQDSFSAAPVTTGVTAVSFSPMGFVGGGQIGCDYQFAPTWVVGIEGAASGSTLKGSTTVGLPLGLPGEAASVSGAMDLVPSVTARIGYAADRWLFYLKGGVAWEGSNFSVGNSINVAGTTLLVNASGSGTQTGGLLGMGVEYAFLPNWSAKLEYDYIDFGTRSFSASIGTNAAFAATGLAALSGAQVPVSITENEHLIKAGVNYRF